MRWVLPLGIGAGAGCRVESPPRPRLLPSLLPPVLRSVHTAALRAVHTAVLRSVHMAVQHDSDSDSDNDSDDDETDGNALLEHREVRGTRAAAANMDHPPT